MRRAFVRWLMPEIQRELVRIADRQLALESRATGRKPSRPPLNPSNRAP